MKRVISVFALSMILFAATAQANDRTLTVRSEGWATFTPRKASFNLSASTTSKTNAQASSDNANTVQQLKVKLLELGITEKQVRLNAAMSIPNYARDNQGRITNNIETWTTTQDVLVKVPYKTASNLTGQVYQTATNYNNVRISGPSPIITQTAMRGATLRANASAVKRAFLQAERQVAATRGKVQLGQLLQVAPVQNEQYQYGGRGAMMLEAAVNQPNMAPAFSAAEKQFVTQSVDATFKLE